MRDLLGFRVCFVFVGALNPAGLKSASDGQLSMRNPNPHFELNVAITLRVPTI